MTHNDNKLYSTNSYENSTWVQRNSFLFWSKWYARIVQITICVDFRQISEVWKEKGNVLW